MLAVAGLYRRTLLRGACVTAVTGSYGKTTTVRALRAILGLEADGWAELNTNCLGEVAWTLLREAPWCGRVVAEVGAGTPGKLARYAAVLRPDVVVVTCLGQEHLAAFGSVEAIRAEKAELVSAVGSAGCVILNGDDPQVRLMAGRSRGRVVWFGEREGHEFRGTDLREEWPRGLCFTLETGGRAYPVRLRWPGSRAVVPALASLAAGVQSGVPVEEAIRRLETVAPTPGRLAATVVPGGAVVVRDDYKATPETVMAALSVLAAAPARRRWVVMGDLNNLPGPDEAAAYREVGLALGRVAERVVVVGERGPMYAAGFGPEERERCRLEAVPDVASALALLRPVLGEGDVVLIKGYEDQGLARVALALEGREVGCGVRWCVLRHQRCDDCRYLGDPASPGGRIRHWGIPGFGSGTGEPE